MERTYLEPAGIAPPPEPYSHAIRCGDTLYIAGQVAFDEQNRTVGVGDPRRQAEQVWHNIRLAVEAAGGTLADVVKITVFLKDVRHAPAEISVRESLFQLSFAHQLLALLDELWLLALGGSLRKQRGWSKGEGDQR